MTLFKNILNNSVHFPTILSEPEASKSEFLNNTKTIFFSLRFAVLPCCPIWDKSNGSSGQTHLKDEKIGDSQINQM